MSESNEPRRPDQPASDSERIADAMARLERAVNDLASAAGDRAADYVERATDRLREESAYRPQRPHRPRFHDRQREPAWLWSDRPRSAKLYRDADNGKVFGVCAGIANYYGMETWVVRCIAVTGLIFLTGVVFVAYLVAALILDKNPGEDIAQVRERTAGGQRRRQHLHPAERLRDARASLEELELRLRRMETHVTSGRYELQRELAKIGASS